MEPLKTMLQHQSVNLIQDIHAHFHRVVRCDADDVAIERGMMQLAERQSVRNPRVAFWISVGDDMCSFEELLMAQAADRAVLAIRFKHTFTECLLVKALSDQSSHIATSDVDDVGRLAGRRG